MANRSGPVLLLSLLACACACETVPDPSRGAAAQRERAQAARVQAAADLGPVTVMERARVQRVVREFFLHAQRGRCEHLTPLLGGDLRADFQRRGGCARILEREPESLRRSLARMEMVRRDPDDPSAYLVPIVIRDGEEERARTARVRHHEDSYSLVSLGE